VGLAVILSITIAGFLLKKTRLFILGSLAICLPTIGFFALTMFFLAGVGALRLLWLPFTDSDSLTRLGLITFLPAWIANTAITRVAELVIPGFYPRVHRGLFNPNMLRSHDHRANTVHPSHLLMDQR